MEKSASAKGSNTNCCLYLLFSFSSTIPSKYWSLIVPIWLSHGSLLLQTQLITEAGTRPGDMSNAKNFFLPYSHPASRPAADFKLHFPALTFKIFCVGSRTGDPLTLPEPFPKQRTAPSFHQGDGREPKPNLEVLPEILTSTQKSGFPNCAVPLSPIPA